MASEQTVEVFERWTAELAGTVGQEVRRYRKQRGLSAQQLADRAAAEYGLGMTRSTLSDLENGRRPNVRVSELLVLAEILGVPPVQLLCPIGHQEEMEILPGRSVPTGNAAHWISGEAPLVSKRRGPGGETLIEVQDLDAWLDGSQPSRAMREHSQFIDRRSRALHDAAAAQWYAKDADRAGRPDEAAAHRARADAETRAARAAEDAIRQRRAWMREIGLTPPPLRPDVAHLDSAPPPGMRVVQTSVRDYERPPSP